MFFFHSAHPFKTNVVPLASNQEASRSFYQGAGIKIGHQPLLCYGLNKTMSFNPQFLIMQSGRKVKIPERFTAAFSNQSAKDVDMFACFGMKGNIDAGFNKVTDHTVTGLTLNAHHVKRDTC